MDAKRPVRASALDHRGHLLTRSLARPHLNPLISLPISEGPERSANRPRARGGVQLRAQLAQHRAELGYVDWLRQMEIEAGFFASADVV